MRNDLKYRPEWTEAAGHFQGFWYNPPEGYPDEPEGCPLKSASDDFVKPQL